MYQQRLEAVHFTLPPLQIRWGAHGWCGHSRAKAHWPSSNSLYVESRCGIGHDTKKWQRLCRVGRRFATSGNLSALSGTSIALLPTWGHRDGLPASKSENNLPLAAPADRPKATGPRSTTSLSLDTCFLLSWHCIRWDRSRRCHTRQYAWSSTRNRGNSKSKPSRNTKHSL